VREGGRSAGRSPAAPKRKTSPLLDTRVIFCGDNLDKLKDFPDASVDLIYIDPPFNSNRNYEVFWGETREKRSFQDRHASTQAYIDFMRPHQGARAVRCLPSVALRFALSSRLRRAGSAKEGHPERGRPGDRVERVSPCVVWLLPFIPHSALRVPRSHAFFRRSGKSIIVLTVKEILDEEIAKKLA